MHSMKKLLFTAAFIISCFFAINVYADNVSVIIDGRTVKYGSEPIVSSGRVLLPLRDTFERLGCDVSWNGDLNLAQISLGGKIVQVRPGSSEISVNGEPVNMDCPAEESEGKLFIPVRYAAEALGFDVSWNEDMALVIIYTEKYACYSEGFGIPVYSDIIASASDIAADLWGVGGYAYATSYEDVTEYIMLLQNKYGFEYRDTGFSGESTTHTYVNASTMCTVSVTCGETDGYGYAVQIVPESHAPKKDDGALQDEKTPAREEPKASEPREEAEIQYYENTNSTLPTFTFITGSQLSERTSKDGTDIYKYSGGFMGAAQYTSAISFYFGYREYRTNLDFGTITRYYKNGDITVGIITSLFTDEVWIVIPQGE